MGPFQGWFAPHEGGCRGGHVFLTEGVNCWAQSEACQGFPVAG